MVIWCAHATCSMVISAHFRPHRHPPSRDTCYLFSHLGPHDASFFFSSFLLFFLSSNARLLEICRKIAVPSVYFHRFVSFRPLCATCRKCQRSLCYCGYCAGTLFERQWIGNYLVHCFTYICIFLFCIYFAHNYIVSICMYI